MHFHSQGSGISLSLPLHNRNQYYLLKIIVVVDAFFTAIVARGVSQYYLPQMIVVVDALFTASVAGETSRCAYLIRINLIC